MTKKLFQKKTIISAVAKWHAAVLEALSRRYVYEKYYSGKELTDENGAPLSEEEYDAKLKRDLSWVPVYMYEFKEDYLSKTEWQIIAYLYADFGEAWQMEPPDLEDLMEGNQYGPRTFSQYMGEEPLWDGSYMDDVTSFAEVSGETTYDLLDKSRDEIKDEIKDESKDEKSKDEERDLESVFEEIAKDQSYLVGDDTKYLVKPKVKQWLHDHSDDVSVSYIMKGKDDDDFMLNKFWRFLLKHHNLSSKKRTSWYDKKTHKHISNCYKVTCGQSH